MIVKIEDEIKNIQTEKISYCSDYDETCHKLDSPLKCFLGGLWICENGYISNMPLADGICRMMEKNNEE